MLDLVDSKNEWVVFDADSDALISFSIFYFLRVLFPPGSWWTFWSINKIRRANGAQIFSEGPTFKGESHDHKIFPKVKNFTLSRSKV